MIHNNVIKIEVKKNKIAQIFNKLKELANLVCTIVVTVLSISSRFIFFEHFFHSILDFLFMVKPLFFRFSFLLLCYFKHIKGQNEENHAHRPYINGKSIDQAYLIANLIWFYINHLLRTKLNGASVIINIISFILNIIWLQLISSAKINKYPFVYILMVHYILKLDIHMNNTIHMH